MAQYGRIRVIVRDADGTRISGADVEVRRQGATINGNQSTPTNIVVHDVGGVVIGSNLRLDTDSSPTVTCTDIPDATHITVGVTPGSVTDDQRLSVVNALPSLFRDANGDEAETNPFQTDSTGTAEAWAAIEPYDILVSGTGVATAYLLKDYIPSGHERIISNVLGTGTARAFILNTTRALTSGDIIWVVQEDDVDRVYIEQDGTLVVVAGGANITGNTSVTGTLTSSGALTVSSGGAAVTGNSTVTGTLTTSSTMTVTAGGEVISAGGLQVSGTHNGADTLTVNTGHVQVAASTGNLTVQGAGLGAGVYANRFYAARGTSLVSGDFSGSGWGTGATYTPLTGSKDQMGQVEIATGTASFVANPTVTLTFKDGTWSNAPFGVAICVRSGGASVDGFGCHITGFSNVSVTWTVYVTPTTSETYRIQWIMMGR